MSKRTDKLELEIEKLGKDNVGKSIPVEISDWMVTEGILAGTIIEKFRSIKDIGQTHKCGLFW